MPYWSKSFYGLPEHLTKVREFTRLVAGGRDGAELVEMVVSELAGNAIQHSASGRPGGKFTLELADLQDGWHIRVVDQGGPKVPSACALTSIEDAEDLDDLGDEIEAGRGLAIVAEVSASWGFLGDHTTRSVWAKILIPGQSQHESLEEESKEQHHMVRERR
jgi:anti-sigma regulatory factor (Ser/Thr protein kinase)